MGLLEDAIAAGDTQAEARLSPFFEAAQYDYKANRGMPPGAVSDTGSPLGFVIPDAAARERYAQSEGDLARGVASGNYMDAFYRDRLKNTLAIMKASDHLDPDLQALVMQKLGVQIPGMGGGTQTAIPGLPTPWGHYMGARADAKGGMPQDFWGENMVAGGGAGGFMGRKLRDEITKLQVQHQLTAPDKEADRAVRLMTAQTGLLNATNQDAYHRQMANLAVEKARNQRLAQLDDLGKAYVAVAPTVTDPPEEIQRKNVLRQIYIGMSNKINAELMQLDANYGGGGPPNQQEIGDQAAASAMGGGGDQGAYGAVTPDNQFGMMLKELHNRITGGRGGMGISAPVAPQSAAPATSGSVGGKKYTWTKRQ